MPQAKKKLYLRLLGYIKSYWPAMVIAAFGNVIYAAVDSYSIHLFKPIIDKGFNAKDTQFLHMLPFIVIGLFLLRGVGSFISSYYMGWVGRRVVLRFRTDMFARLMMLPAHYFDNITSGKLLSRLTFNVEQVTQATGSALTTLVRESCFVIGLLIVMFITSWRLTLLIFLIVPFLWLVVSYAGRRFRRLSHRIQNAMGDITHLAEESILGYREVRIYGGQQHQNRRFSNIAGYNYLQEMKVIVTDALSTPIIQLLGALVLALIIYLAFHNPGKLISAGSFVTLLASMIAILKPIKNLSQVNSNIQKGLAAAESIFDMLDEPIEADSGTKRLTNARGDIEFKQLGFGYKVDQIPALHDINFKVKAGQTVALVGHSGGGKSTIVNLLARFYVPTHGQILIDKIDIQSLKLENLRSQLAMVSQHVTLFDDTIANNIAYGGTEQATPAQIIAAAKAAHAWEFIEQLPKGLETMIGENGLNLSGGQRQRVAIARALLKDAPILILDEATSALDNESERAIKQALADIKQQRTILIIAHRLSTVEKADKIVVIEHGTIVEVGSHQQLLDKKGAYAKLRKSDELR